MLDIETRRRIDTARDILVGKVPDPKSQVEQITIALIYKFMADMDAEAEELGGKRTFFAGEFERFGWAQLMAPGLGGHETLNRYAEAITRMTENPGIPALFRDIFKNAYLPYRDPETLRAFLKVIDDFRYDHSERLGDAFEYLLSVLGSQGDAGQFRTPRHIIDFMVAIVDPRKDERILDPACGTAGFLISAYKHILVTNAANGRPGAGLSPDERRRLMDNVRGYDISPDMVRLSLVNLYLHGFNDPHVAEYDTLTSEERWNEHYHVILANPPFMSPKGGIRPHKRFSVQSNRSEVLFVDYIAEHLAPGGRAAVIVPEGVIFQSGKAYKALRKLLVEEYLAGVISLPAGVFNPYSGVKTSILWLDRTIARQSDSILFVKIEADGFDLGAQRKESKRNDLPEALAALLSYKKNVVAEQSTLIDDHRFLRFVSRDEIAQSDDYNLSGERYSKSSRETHTSFPLISLGELCTFMTGGTPTSTVREYYDGGTVPWLVSGDIHRGVITNCEGRITELGVENSNAKYLPKNSVLIALNGQGKTRGTVALLRMEKATCNQSLVAMTPKSDSGLLPEFLYHVLRSMYQDIRNITGDNQRSGLNMPLLRQILIPLPPLPIQEALVAEIESYRRIIDGARQVVANWRPRIEVDAAWPLVALEEVCTVNPKKSELNGTPPHLPVSFIPMADLNENQMDFVPQSEKPLGDVIKGYTYFRDQDVLLAKVTPCFENGKAGIAAGLTNGIGFGSSEYIVLRAGQKVLPIWLYLNVTSPMFREEGIRRMTGTGGLQRVPIDFVAAHPIAVPSIEIQQQVVEQIKREQAIINANRDLITLYEQKIKARLARVWGQ